VLKGERRTWREEAASQVTQRVCGTSPAEQPRPEGLRPFGDAAAPSWSQRTWMLGEMDVDLEGCAHKILPTPLESPPSKTDVTFPP